MTGKTTLLTLLSWSCLTAFQSVYGQLTIPDGTPVSIQGTFATADDITNKNSSASNVSSDKASLVLVGSNHLTTASRMKISNLVLNGNLEKTLLGELEITNALTLNSILTPGSSAKIIFSGSDSRNINVSPGYFVNGPFYSRGTGVRVFPVGFNDGTVPISSPAAFINMTNGTDEVGVRVVNGDPQLQAPQELEQILTTRYWIVDSPRPISSPVALSFNQLILPDGPLVVVQASQTGQVADNLKGSADQSFVRSEGSATMPVLAIGVARTFDIVIHDLITPFTVDGANDVLLIDNIDLTEENTVTLMDRWGVVHRSWENYDANNPQFEFKKLSPGNYICIVEYQLPGSSEKKKKSQMVTVLKTN